jgi:hypothetical protein
MLTAEAMKSSRSAPVCRRRVMCVSSRLMFPLDGAGPPAVVGNFALLTVMSIHIDSSVG